jgi:hypothetical protein
LPPFIERYRLPLQVLQGIMAIGMILGPPSLLLFLLSRTRPIAAVANTSEATHLPSAGAE